MGTAELWTTDNSLYKFTESTSMNPNDGEIIREQEELRRRMIHLRRSAPSSPSTEQPPQSPQQQQTIDYDALRSKPIDTEHPESYTKQLYYAFMVASLCNNSSISQEEDGEFKPVGDPTEIALTVAAEKGGLGRAYWTEKLGFTKVFERAFDSERKLMSSVFSAGQQENMVVDDDKLVMTCKGAPEELLRNCSHFMTNEGRTELTEDFGSKVYDENVRMASQGLRVLGLAYKIIPANSMDQVEKGEDSEEPSSSSSNQNPHLLEAEMTFVGLVGLIDPPKQGVKEAVATCQEAGIHVMMITGDHVETATAIAKELGIFKNNVPGMVSLI